MNKKLLSALAALTLCMQPIAAYAAETAEEEPAVESSAAEVTATQEIFADSETTSEETKAFDSDAKLDKGDINGDKLIDIEDAVGVINYINGVKPLFKNQLDAADLNKSDTVDIEDVVILINYINGLCDITGKSNGTEPKEEEDPKPTNTDVKYKKLTFTNVKQNPELPTGGEVTALAAVLKYYNYSIDKVTLARTYMPQSGLSYKDGKMIGPDLHKAFAGNPETYNAYGCYSGCITITANNYLAKQNAKHKCFDLTGTDLDKLFPYVAEGDPVIIWTTSGLVEPKVTDTWHTSEGKEVKWLANENATVITGFDLDNKLVYLSDPYSGDVVYSLDAVKTIYEKMGKQAVVLRGGTPTETKTPEQPTTNKSKQISFKNILQNPELPSAGEVTALTALLNHIGYSIDKVTLARTYMPKLGFTVQNGKRYGADFYTTFAGDPESSYGYGCMAPCIVTTANNYLTKINGTYRAKNLTGTELDTLLTDYIDKDKPVLVWVTTNLKTPEKTDKWLTSDGKEVQWIAHECCVVLTGYDKDKSLIYCSDPYLGDMKYDWNSFKNIYGQMGKQAIALNYEGTSTTPQQPTTSNNVKKIDAKVVLQNPELPTGGEVTALTIALNQVGFSVDKVTLADKYLPKQEFYVKDGKNYGADFNTTFAGDPTNSWSYGCLAPCIQTTGANYLKTQNTTYQSKNITGTDFDKLLTDYTAKDKLVLIWITSNLQKPEYTDSWYSPDGKVMKWPKYETCVVLTGYDLDKKLIYAIDPGKGSVALDLETVKARYADMGKNAVVIDK